jgi:hypothetical protein
MENKNKLESFSTTELVNELRRRIAELDEARALLSGAGASSSTKNPRISASKAEYWAAWHSYKSAHPGATVTEWRKSQKAQRKAK